MKKGKEALYITVSGQAPHFKTNLKAVRKKVQMMDDYCYRELTEDELDFEIDFTSMESYFEDMFFK